MYIVRPVEISDIAALESLAAVASLGVHTLPKTRATITRAVERSLASFATPVMIPSEESYMFVLESTLDRSIAGTAAISANAGSNGTYFAFRNSCNSCNACCCSRTSSYASTSKSSYKKSNCKKSNAQKS